MPIFENTQPVAWDNPRATKVNKMHNGKRSPVATMTGVSRERLAATPSLRIAQNYYIELDHGYVDLVFCATSTRLQRAILADSTLGWVKDVRSDRYRVRVGKVVNNRLQRSRTLSDYQWYLLASRVFPSQDYPSVVGLVEKLSTAVDKAIAICPTLCLARDRTDNPRYNPAITHKGRTVAGEIRLTNKQPKPSTVRVLAKRNG